MGEKLVEGYHFVESVLFCSALRESLLSRSTDMELNVNIVKIIKFNKLSDKIRSFIYTKYTFNFALTP